MAIQLENRSSALTSLRTRWAAFSLACSLLLGSGFLLLWMEWHPIYAIRWLVLSTLVMVYLLWVFWGGLEQNHRDSERHLLPTLGLGNSLTLLRGALIAALVGFLFSPIPASWLAWIPAILYTLACIADYLDGYLARITNHATRLGETLDMSFDGAGVLAASFLAVQYGQVPAWYLLVALARPLFLAGLWLRRRLGKPIYELPPSISRRAFAGVQMGFLAAILWPVFSPPGTHIAAAIFALPFLVGFSRDWLFASGAIRTSEILPARFRDWITAWLPVLLRLVIAMVALLPLVKGLLVHSTPVISFGGQGWQSAAVNLEWFEWPEIVIVLLLLFGIAGRITAILGLCLVGFHQMFAGLTPSQVFLVIAYTAILFMGSGALSLWKPEDRLIYRRAGER